MPTQPRNTIISSVSFDPEVFHKMEAYLNKSHMSRSEYLNLLVRADSKRKGPLVIPEDDLPNEPQYKTGLPHEPKYPIGLLPNPDSPSASRVRRSKRK